MTIINEELRALIRAEVARALGGVDRAGGTHITLTEMARRLGVSPGTIKNYIDRGVIPAGERRLNRVCWALADLPKYEAAMQEYQTQACKKWQKNFRETIAARRSATP